MTRRRLGWFVATLLSMLIVLYATAYFRFDPRNYFPQPCA